MDVYVGKKSQVSFQLATDSTGRQQYPGLMFRHVSCPLTLYSILFLYLVLGVA